jgi:hypothetical protein
VQAALVLPARSGNGWTPIVSPACVGRKNRMLTNLFRLDGTPAVFASGAGLPSMSPGELVSNAVFTQDPWSAPVRNVRGVTFRGVAFSRVTVEKVTFTDCGFEDCLFLGTKFADVEFHNCSFLNCNFWKAKFERVYINPDSIVLERRFRVEAANAGISVYQALLGNFQDDRQDEFYRKADIRFRRWKRYQIWRDLRCKHISLPGAYGRWMSSILYEMTTGFGYKPWRFALVTLIVFFLVSVVNHYAIGHDVILAGSQPENVSFADTVFYTFSLLKVLGSSSFVPISPGGKLLAVFEALAAIGWLAIFTSVLVKRVLR